MSEWFMELVLKTSDSARGRGFESLSLRHFSRGAGSAKSIAFGLEKYPRGRRGSPAKGVVRDERSEGSNPSFSAKQKSTQRGGLLLWCEAGGREAAPCRARNEAPARRRVCRRPTANGGSWAGDVKIPPSPPKTRDRMVSGFLLLYGFTLPRPFGQRDSRRSDRCRGKLPRW